jgi:hypothetical protein
LARALLVPENELHAHVDPVRPSRAPAPARCTGPPFVDRRACDARRRGGARAAASRRAWPAVVADRARGRHPQPGPAAALRGPRAARLRVPRPQRRRARGLPAASGNLGRHRAGPSRAVPAGGVRGAARAGSVPAAVSPAGPVGGDGEGPARSRGRHPRAAGPAAPARRAGRLARGCRARRRDRAGARRAVPAGSGRSALRRAELDAAIAELLVRALAGDAPSRALSDPAPSAPPCR